MTGDATNTDKLRNQYLQSILQKTDIRSTKPEYRIILDALQEISPTTVQELLVEINEKCGFEMFTYASLWNHIKTLKGLGAVKQNEISKAISIDPAHITHEIRYLPLSSSCVYLFGISIVALIYTMFYAQYLVAQATGIVVMGVLYGFAQLLGSEFDFKELIEELKEDINNIRGGKTEKDGNTERSKTPITGEPHE